MRKRKPEHVVAFCTVCGLPQVIKRTKQSRGCGMTPRCHGTLKGDRVVDWNLPYPHAGELVQ